MMEEEHMYLIISGLTRKPVTTDVSHFNKESTKIIVPIFDKDYMNMGFHGNQIEDIGFHGNQIEDTEVSHLSSESDSHDV